ncbi:unnamed protein product [Brachionus calyciflorus]|uniref:Translocation protein SEC62 n=1 Tax=Brachionus calyciflorus TaxID=104777 RepID=A0A813M431_9BILA|nr:unnamed protein product [Brachionus calyciflorus]
MSNQSSGSIDSKKRNKKSKDNEQDMETLTKDEQQIARFLRLSCPNKQGNLHGMKVDFFIGNKLVDSLMESKWGPGKEGQKTNKQPLLANRQACVAFMQRLMNKQLFHRAIKVYKDNVESKSENPEGTPSVRKRKNNTEDQKSSPNPKENTQKRKFKLEIHEDYRFVDANEPYVWVYDPTSTKTYIIGSLLILGAIGICLFPLWPSQVREGVYYVSLAGASFLGGILGLAVFKYILFALIWLCTLGSVHFWLFPNLTEDVGFFESFVPVYKFTSSSTKTSKKESTNQETDKPSSEQEIKKDENETKTGKKSVPNTPKLKSATKELSKSTLEINSVSDSPDVRRKASTKEEDGFELVGDDEDLDKN